MGKQTPLSSDCFEDGQQFVPLGLEETQSGSIPILDVGYPSYDRRVRDPALRAISDFAPLVVPLRGLVRLVRRLTS